MADNLRDLLYSRASLTCLFIFIATLFFYYHKKRKLRRIWQWQHSLNLEKHQQVFHQLYHEINGFRLSYLARQKQDAIEFTYGEIEFLPFIALLSLVKPDCDTVFYDLGSGTGKAVLACAMVYPVHQSIGVEILPELYQSACTQSQQLATNPDYLEAVKKIEFISGDFLEVDLSQATLIFINSTTMFGCVWEKLCARLNDLPQLNTVITTSKSLISNNFLPVNCTKIQMSWGVVDAFIHIRKTNLH